MPNSAAALAPVSRARYHDLTTSPMRSGKMLFAMKPTETARASGAVSIGWIGSVRCRQRRARNQTSKK